MDLARRLFRARTPLENNLKIFKNSIWANWVKVLETLERASSLYKIKNTLAKIAVMALTSPRPNSRTRGHTSGTATSKERMAKSLATRQRTVVKQTWEAPAKRLHISDKT